MIKCKKGIDLGYRKLSGKDVIFPIIEHPLWWEMEGGRSFERIDQGQSL